MDRNVSYNLHKMTTDIIFGHGRALQFERYITCKSIDIISRRYSQTHLDTTPHLFTTKCGEPKPGCPRRIW